jgi:hypothetical protein
MRRWLKKKFVPRYGEKLKFMLASVKTLTNFEDP